MKSSVSTKITSKPILKHPPKPKEIREKRKEKRLSQSASATIIHKTAQSWSDYECGRAQMDLAYWELYLIKTADLR